MAITSIELTDFTVFRSAKLELSPGINVLIGENATGKTHVLKALYAMVRATLDPRSSNNRTTPIGARLFGVFRPDDGLLRGLSHRAPGLDPTPLEASLRIWTSKKDTAGWILKPEFGDSTDASVLPGSPNATFIPSREALAMFEGFIAAYQKRELSFDETYYDLAVSLSASPLREPNEALRQIADEFEDVLGGKVELDGPRFYVRAENGDKLEAPLLSEGMRKLATIVRLLNNGELAPGGLLLWDEPEANLNPKLTVKVASALKILAFHGVQVVLASHDYLLVETLAHYARIPNGTSTRFFGFERTEDRSAVTVHAADDLDDLPSNAIRAQFLEHYDRINGIAE